MTTMYIKLHLFFNLTAFTVLLLLASRYHCGLVIIVVLTFLQHEETAVGISYHLTTAIYYPSQPLNPSLDFKVRFNQQLRIQYKTLHFTDLPPGTEHYKKEMLNYYKLLNLIHQDIQYTSTLKSSKSTGLYLKQTIMHY